MAAALRRRGPVGSHIFPGFDESTVFRRRGAYSQVGIQIAAPGSPHLKAPVSEVSVNVVRTVSMSVSGRHLLSLYYMDVDTEAAYWLDLFEKLHFGSTEIYVRNRGLPLVCGSPLRECIVKKWLEESRSRHFTD